MNDTDLKDQVAAVRGIQAATDMQIEALSGQLAAAEDRIVELQHQVNELKESLLLAADVIDHMWPSRVSVIKARLRALDEEGAA